MKLDGVSFRKMAIGFFSCFPNIEKISVSAFDGSYSVEFWKRGFQIDCDYDGWKNVNYRFLYANNSTSKTGRIAKIPLKFLGYKGLSSGTTQYNYCIDRKNLRLKSKQKNINSQEKLNQMLTSVSYVNTIKSMKCIGYGDIEFTNTDGEQKVVNFRGSGVKFAPHYRYEVTKNC